jgi:hypothetical protein
MKIMLITAALALNSPVLAKDGVPEDKETAKKSTNEKSANLTRKICRNQPIIGTRVGKKRVCATAAEWAHMRSDLRQTTERVQNGKFTYGD